ncbi:MAG: hypothetical protein DMD96_06010 [Candidatus Rokuibacteriota bacterium]|nr:MAG: hypothetical protein DMD96_06010 [Candidatus Rokubacteria bacterium]
MTADTCRALVARLRWRGVRLIVDSEGLEARGPSFALKDDVMVELRARKAELLALLAAEPEVAGPEALLEQLTERGAVFEVLGPRDLLWFAPPGVSTPAIAAAVATLKPELVSLLRRQLRANAADRGRRE